MKLDSQKNSILYSSGWLFTASGSMEISMYNNSTIPSLDPTTYSIWKVKIWKYTIIAKELKWNYKERDGLNSISFYLNINKERNLIEGIKEKI